jgi:di/tricarboxylate transporter
VRFLVGGGLPLGRVIKRLYEKTRLQANDVLLVRTNPDELATIQQEPGIDLYPIYKYQNGGTSSNHSNSDDEDANRLVQAVLAPGSELAGQTIGKMNFLERYGVIVAGIWRKSTWLRAELSRVRLHEGDVLLLYGLGDAFDRLKQDRSFLMLVPFQGEPFMRRRAPLAGLILVASIIVAALGIVPVEIAFLSGASIAVLTRCLNIHQAYRSIDTRIYVFIAGAIPLGLAMQSTGTSDLIADSLFRFLAAWPPSLILLLLFAVSAVLTQMMSDAGTVALLGPVVISLALALGHAPETYVVIVAVAAVASFLTPIGHHGNLLVYGPGGYQFTDFIRVGTPLTFLVGIVSIIIVQLIWPI